MFLVYHPPQTYQIAISAQRNGPILWGQKVTTFLSFSHKLLLNYSLKTIDYNRPCLILLQLEINIANKEVLEKAK